MPYKEHHYSHRTGWLRAAVLGANDGIVSTSSLIIGFAAADADRPDIILAGLAGLVAGALSMAAGEYVSVSSQSDTENADLEIERRALEEDEEHETAELAEIYENRGVQPELALEVAKQLMRHDALGAHARDEIGITDISTARPLQAALSSCAAFTVGASLPLVVAFLSPLTKLIVFVALFSLVFLAVLGAVSARAGGASKQKAALRVTFWGALAMALTAFVGHLFGAIV